MTAKYLHFLIEVSNAGQVEEQLSSRAEFEHKEQLSWGLERISQLNDEGVLHIFLISINSFALPKLIAQRSCAPLSFSLSNASFSES